MDAAFDPNDRTGCGVENTFDAPADDKDKKAVDEANEVELANDAEKPQ